jgi:1-hydroxycarotenoid 3,4-desaturase
MGGLVTALELACQGLDVTLLEKECQAGGKLSQLEVAGQRLDCGPTVLTMPWVFDDIFKRAGAGFRERVALTPLERLASHAWRDGSQLDLFSDTEQSAAAIRAFAGEREANGYRRFAQRAQQVFEQLDQPFMRRSCSGPMQLMRAVGLRRMPELWQIAPFKTLHSVLKEYFDDARLLQLFGRYATYCGSSPYACPATLMLVTHVERCGVWSVAGGMVQLAQALTSLCMERGVTFNYHAEVASVLVEKRRVSGLQLTNGTSVRADVIVMNADAAALPQGCFGEQARGASISMSRSQRSLSALTWSMVTAPSGRPLARHNVFFSDDYRAEFEDLFRHRRLPQQPTVYVCAQDQDAATTSPHANQRLFCLVNAPADGDLKPLQQEEIDLCQQRMLLLLKQCGVMVDPAPHSMTITTPSHFSQRYPASGGALYGPASHGWTASFRRARARTSIEGLYLAGGSTHPGPGLPMAALSGTIAAQAVLSDLALSDRYQPMATPGGIWTP